MLQFQDQKPLVYIDQDKPVTDSLTIADAFEKGHDKVLRDIRSLRCSDQFRLANFGESSYTNKQGRVMPMYILTFDGFAMLAMGYSGAKAMAFKEQYINEFNRTRQLVESQKLLELQDESTLLSAEQKQIQSLIQSVIYFHYPRITHQARQKYFARLYRDLKTEFDVRSFRDIRRTDLENAIYFIQQWHSPNLESHYRRDL